MALVQWQNTNDAAHSVWVNMLSSGSSTYTGPISYDNVGPATGYVTYGHYIWAQQSADDTYDTTVTAARNIAALAAANANIAYAGATATADRNLQLTATTDNQADRTELRGYQQTYASARVSADGTQRLTNATGRKTYGISVVTDESSYQQGRHADAGAPVFTREQYDTALLAHADTYGDGIAGSAHTWRTSTAQADRNILRDVATLGRDAQIDSASRQATYDLAFADAMRDLQQAAADTGSGSGATGYDIDYLRAVNNAEQTRRVALANTQAAYTRDALIADKYAWLQLDIDVATPWT